MMVKSMNIIEKLHQKYFDLLTDAPWYTYERTVQQVVAAIRSITNMSYVSIVIQKNWSNASGHITEEYSPQTSQLFREYSRIYLKKVLEQIHVHSDAALEENMHIFDVDDEQKEQDVFHMIPLHISDVSAGYLMCIYKENEHSTWFIQQLQKNTEQLLKTAKWVNDKREMNEKNEFLFELTSELYTSVDQTFILREAISALEYVYPNFTYTLLLSQDYQADDSLPIQMIEYSGDYTKRVSTDVFISGDTRIEKGLEEESYLYTPLPGKQGIYGVLQIKVDKGIQLPEEEIHFITLFSNVIGEALENAILYENSKHLASDLKLINEVTHTLHSNLKLPEIISVIKKQVTNICDPTHIGFVFFSQEAHSKAQQIDILQGSTPYFFQNEGQYFIEEMISIAREQKEPLFKADFKTDTYELPFRSIMSLPMFHAGQVIGIVTIGHEQSSAFSFESFKIMKTLIQNTTLALMNSVLKDKLERAVITDYLTKLYSRSYLDEKIDLYMEVDSEGALVLFDIDDFKHINDVHGHQVGDQVIVQVANILKANTRKHDVAARWGGEELALYLPHASIEEGVRVAREIRKKVEQETHPSVTLSSGVSYWNLMTNHNVDTLFIEADKSLYKAKERGKNQVVYTSEMTSEGKSRQSVSKENKRNFK